MSELAFLSPALARTADGFTPRYRSPLERALAGVENQLQDLSALGKLEVRGELETAALEGQTLGRVPNGHVPNRKVPGSVPRGVEIVRITPTRALVLCEPEALPAIATRLSARAALVVDVSAALAGLALRGEQLMRRLTDLDLDGLPAVGAVAGVQCTVLRNESEGDGDEFRLFFAQEYADHVAAVVLDAIAGLR